MAVELPSHRPIGCNTFGRTLTVAGCIHWTGQPNARCN
jgi:hypothetical protein